MNGKFLAMLLVVLLSFAGVSNVQAQSVSVLPGTATQTIELKSEHRAKAYNAHGPRWGQRHHRHRRPGKMANHTRKAPRHRPNGHRPRGSHR